jgi:DNA recombination protein RmuC
MMQSFVNDNLVLLALLTIGIILFLFFLKKVKIFFEPMEEKPLKDAIVGLGEQVRILGEGQQQLTGSLRTITEAQATSQTKLITVINERLAAVQNTMSERLQGSATKTARSLGELQQRLETIDKAQENIEKLSGNVLSLQDILSNKQTRGAFGEIQLEDIVSKALPPDSYTFQATLSNGKRADCLLKLPNPPGSIVIDSKFPLEAYENLRNASNSTEVVDATRMMKTSIRAHIKAISEKYIIEGETAESAMMFLPSEAVYAELHANFPQVVREGFKAKVWIVSPTTCMATLNTMRAILKDARMREQAGAIRIELGLLFKDVERLSDRVMNLDRHFVMASKDIEEIKISAKRSGNRARKLDNFDFEEISVDPTVVQLSKTDKL